MTSNGITAYPLPLRTADSVVLAALPNAAGLSRAMVEIALERWGLNRIAETAELVVSELVTNAVKATGLVVEHPTWEQVRDVSMLKIRIQHGESFVLIEVWDSDPTAPPKLAAASPEAESGRGLAIVDVLCQNWGSYPSAGGGKVVWAEVRIPPLPMTAAGLPKRIRGAAEPYKPVVRWDRSALTRIYEALNERL